MAAVAVKRGDGGSLSATLRGPDGNVVDLTGETVRFHMASKLGGAAKVDGAAVVVDGPAGLVRYDWSPGDLDTTGTFYAEFEVQSGPETFPSDSWILVRVVEDLA